MDRQVGKNAFCPCGSGRKYKRCCLSGNDRGSDSPSPEARVPGVNSEEIDRVARKFLKHLKESVELPRLLDLPEIDFGVHPFDPFMDDLHDLRFEEGVNPERFQVRLGLGLQKHATDEIRSKLADELELRTKRTRKRRVRELAHAAILALEDIGIESFQIGVLFPLYHHYLTRHARERKEFLHLEDRGLDPEVRRLAESAHQAPSAQAYQLLADSLLPLGADALPYLELAIGELTPGEEAASLISILENNPSMRSARLLEILLSRSADKHLENLLFRALEAQPEGAVPNLLYRVRNPELAWALRRSGYRYLVRQGVFLAGDLLLDELLGNGLWIDRCPGPDLDQVTNLLVELRDRRLIGAVIHAISQGALQKAVVKTLEVTLAKNGWWKEIEEGLTNLRREVIVLVPRGTSLEALVRDKLEKDNAASLEAANFRVGIWNEEWNRAYHEDLHWLRPCDMSAPGPQEIGLMREFTEWFKIRVKDWPDEASGEALSRKYQKELGVWMVTPHPKKGGRVPLAIILEEKLATAPSFARSYTDNYKRKKLQDLFAYARALVEEGRMAEARRELNAILQIEPQHAFALRLLRTAK